MSEVIGYFLPADALNEPMRESLDALIERSKHANYTDVRSRINGDYEYFQADWIKHLALYSSSQYDPALVRELIELVKDNEFYRGGKWFELADEIIAQLEAKP